MNPNIDQISLCDLIIYKGGGIIALGTFSNFVHVAGIVGINRESKEIEIVEAHLVTKMDGEVKTGVQRKTISINTLSDENCIMMRYKRPLTADEKIKIVHWAISGIGSHYDVASFPSKFIRSSLGFLFGWAGWRRGKPWFNSDKLFDCAEYWALDYHNAGLWINKRVHPQSCTPVDFARSKDLIKTFG